MKNHIIALLLTLLTAAVLKAENTMETSVRHITMADGLPANSVRCIFQDSMGFIWLGTINNGLCRYDGTKFTSIRPTYGTEPGLADARISSIKEDRYGRLWIVTMSDQVSCYDLDEEAFVDYTGTGHHMDNYSKVEFIGDDIWLWGSTRGCMRIITGQDGTMTSETFSLATKSLPSDKVTFIYNDTDSSTIWIGTSEGLCRYSDEKLEWVITNSDFTSYARTGNDTHFLTHDCEIWVSHDNEVKRAADFKDICKGRITGTFSPDSSALLIFTTSSSYLYRPATGTLTHAPKPYDIVRAEVKSDAEGNTIVFDKSGNLVYIDGESGNERKIELKVKGEKVFWATRYDFVKTDDSIVWISTHENGLFAYNTATETVQHIETGAKGVSSNILMCVSEDTNGNIWVGTEFSGIFKVNRVSNGASYIHFNEENRNQYSDIARMINTSMDGEVWVGTRDDAVYVFDENLSGITRKMRFGSNIYSICRDKDSVLWLGTRGKGLVIGDREYVNNDEEQHSLSANNIFDILKDRNGNMWVGTFGGGLNLALPDGKGGYVFRHYFNDTYSKRRIRDLNMDSNGMIWVGSSDGVIVFDPEQLAKDPEAYYIYNNRNRQLRSNECKAIYLDSKGRMWVAETGAGFSICTPEDYSALEFTHYSPEDGLINGLVQGFIEDGYGRMWITTEYGVSCFSPESGTFRNYIFSSDMQGNVCLDNCTARLKDGRLLIGTNSGMAIIDPSESMTHAKEPNNAIYTELKVNGATVHPGDPDSPIAFTISKNPDIVLKHDRNSFSLTFSTLGFTSGARYSYYLRNYDKEWTPTSEINTATYRNVPPGKYTMHVKAFDATGAWQENPSSINITIRPPFWRTTAAYIIYILLILAGMVIINRLLIKMNGLRNAAKVEKQLAEYKLMFFTNISHEFRTPLTLILHSMEKLRTICGQTPAATSAIKTMEAGTNRLLRLINQLLEFRKLQNDKHRIQLEQTDAVEFTREIWQTFLDSAADKGIELSFSSSSPSCIMYLDRSDMDKILYNLISNAVKYTHSGGKINVSVTEEDDKVSFKVTDTGIGVPKYRQKDIFTRFNPGESSESSMGIGLHLTKSLVDANKGEIRFNENPEGGTIMTVELPTDINTYNPEDIKETSEEAASLYSGKPLKETVIIKEDENNRPEKPINPHKILVIEDEPDIRRLIAEELREYFNVAEAADGQTGLDMLRKDDTIELVVCDIMMPGISGYEVASQIKNDFNTCHVPVILLTALNSEDKQLQGFQSGADAYVTKPFRPNHILTRILKLLEQRNRLRKKFSNDLTLKTEAICTNDKDREFMDKINAVLEKNLDNPNFSMDDFASELAMGRSSFYNKVHSVTGHSPNKYIRILRMKRAAELLLTGKYTSAEVAYKIGIMDASYFSKSFKEQFGISPKAFYKQAIEGLNRDSNSGD